MTGWGEPTGLVDVHQVGRLHRDGDEAVRVGLRFVLVARLVAGGGVLLGVLGGALLCWRPGRAGQLPVLVVGGAALGLGVLWVVVLRRAARWVNAGLIADFDRRPAETTGLRPGPRVRHQRRWDILRLVHLVLLCVPMAGMALALLSAEPANGESSAEFGRTQWLVTGFCLLMTGIMGGLTGGLAFGQVESSKECWTPRGAVRRLMAYAVPFLLAAPWLAGLHTVWTGALLAVAPLWLLMVPIFLVAPHIPSVPSDD